MNKEKPKQQDSKPLKEILRDIDKNRENLNEEPRPMAVIIIIAFIGLCILLITPNHDPQIAINNVTSMNNGTIYAITTYYTGKPEVAWSECLGTVYYKNNSTNGKFVKATFAIREQVLVRWGEVDIQELCQ